MSGRECLRSIPEIENGQGLMDIAHDYRDLPENARGAVVAIGNFDGIHRGHAHVIEETRKLADELNAPLGLVTFEPHPRQFFAPETPPFRLTDSLTRAHRLEKLGVEKLHELPFDARLAAMSAEDFVREVLVHGLGVKGVVVGEDFRFGKGRAGDVILLERLGRELGFAVRPVPLVRFADGEVSSTAIRTALAEGRPRDAARMLGHWHRIEGPVEHGDKRGRTLGFPTANLAPDPALHLPKFGVYAVLVDVLEGEKAGSYRGAASLGVRPMFASERPMLETYIFDFDGDLYGKRISVGLVDYLRPEMKFDSLDALVSRMKADVAEARQILETLEAGEAGLRGELPRDGADQGSAPEGGENG